MSHKDKEQRRLYFKKYDALRRQRKYISHINWKYIIKRKYGITEEDYNNLLIKQNFSCALCGRHMSEFKRRLGVDHDHETGRVRGLLCSMCNGALGQLGDTASSIKLVTKYLEGV